LRWNREG